MALINLNFNSKDMAERKAFNFYKSYYDVFKELGDKDKLSFIEALLDRQFTGEEPGQLKGMAKFAYISQKSNIDSQIKGWEDKTGCKLESSNPKQGGCVRGGSTPTVQGEEKGEGKEEEEEQQKVINLIYSLYPTKCPVKNSPTGKSKANKAKIKELLKKISPDELESTIKRYIRECTESKTYIKNFGTFLNNIPDYSESETQKEQLYTYWLQDRGTMKDRTEKQYLIDKNRHESNGWEVKLISPK